MTKVSKGLHSAVNTISPEGINRNLVHEYERIEQKAIRGIPIIIKVPMSDGIKSTNLSMILCGLKRMNNGTLMLHGYNSSKNYRIFFLPGHRKPQKGDGLILGDICGFCGLGFFCTGYFSIQGNVVKGEGSEAQVSDEPKKEPSIKHVVVPESMEEDEEGSESDEEGRAEEGGTSSSEEDYDSSSSSEEDPAIKWEMDLSFQCGASYAPSMHIIKHDIMSKLAKEMLTIKKFTAGILRYPYLFERNKQYYALVRDMTWVFDVKSATLAQFSFELVNYYQPLQGLLAKKYGRLVVKPISVSLDGLITHKTNTLKYIRDIEHFKANTFTSDLDRTLAIAQYLRGDFRITTTFRKAKEYIVKYSRDDPTEDSERQTKKPKSEEPPK